MNTKKSQRIRRATRGRANIRRLEKICLAVHRTSNHIYAQLFSSCGSQVLASASTIEKEIRQKLKHGGNKEAAALIGTLIAERGLKAGVQEVAFDRSGNQYHGRVKALADAAREAGLTF